MDLVTRAKEVIALEAEELLKIRDRLGTEFSEAVHLLLDTLCNGGKIVITGIGKNLHIAEKISATLASTGATSVVLHPTQAMHGDLGILAARDTLLALSYSGASEEILALIPLVRRLGVRVLSMTGDAGSPLARLSDVTLVVKVDREACPFNMAPTASTTAALAMGDALAMVLLEARGFRREDYAALHPGGAIGRTLLQCVRDIMRKGDRLAVVPSGATVKDAILAMTRARSGSAGIVDGSQRLLGVFTDGDLRRHITADPELLNRTVDAVMTRRPITVTADCLAVEVLRLFEQYNIDDLLVVDDEGRLIGAVDIQDLPKLKIM